MQRTPQRRSFSPAFTLIELLVVIGIIGVLIAITLVVGGMVMTGGKKSLTQDTLRVLDSAMEAYVKSTDGNPPPTVAGLDPTQPNRVFLAADALDPSTGVMINSVGVFMYQASKVPDAKGVLDKLPSKVVRTFDADGAAASGTQPLLPTVFDGWDKPIRYVHPVFQGDIVGDRTTPNPPFAQPRPTNQVVNDVVSPQAFAMAQIRRNHQGQNGPMTLGSGPPDSDGGTCPGTRPYFYSAGPDGLVGWGMDPAGNVIQANNNVDNVYTTVPNLPKPF